MSETVPPIAPLNAHTLDGWPVKPPAFDALDVAAPVPAEEPMLRAVYPAQRNDLGPWIDRLKETGATAQRHNSPDLIAQLFQALRRPIDTALITVFDSDPALCLNATLAARYAVELSAAATLLGRLTGARQTWFVIAGDVPWEWLGPLRPLARAGGHRIITLDNVYPQADPTLLLFTLLGRRLRPGRLPVEQGVVLLDAAAAVAVGRSALAREMPMPPPRSIPIALRDHVGRRSFFLHVPPGISLATVLDASGLSPHPFLALRHAELVRDLPVDRAQQISSGENVFHATRAEPATNPEPCIRCAWCYESCPTRVQPALVLEAAQHDDAALAERAGVEACIDCGICSFVCPSHLPLLQGVRKMRRAP